MKEMIYLSGPMDGVSIEEGSQWREDATKGLEEHFDLYNPYAGKIPDIKEGKPFTATEIFHRDIYYLDKSSIVLVNLILPDKVESKGMPFFTIGEMFLAHRDRKPIISFTNKLKGRAGYDAIVTKSLTGLDESIDFILKNYT